MTEPVSVMCIGAAAIDCKYRSLAPIRPGTSNPVVSERAPGGVARNVAENLARLGIGSGLVSLVGDDEYGRFLLGHLHDLGVDTRQVAVSQARRTAEYVAVLAPGGELALGLADMEILDDFSADLLEWAWPRLRAAGFVFADCNLPAAVLRRLIAGKRQEPFRLAIDAVSTPKVQRLPGDLTGIDLLFLNHEEASAYLGKDLSPREASAALIARGAGEVVLTLGPDGILTAGSSGMAAVPAHPAEIADVTGAGDALIAATLYGLMRGDPLPVAARTGTVAAALTLECPTSVRPDLSPALLQNAV
jgi:pseudouridine kinase